MYDILIMNNGIGEQHLVKVLEAKSLDNEGRVHAQGSDQEGSIVEGQLHIRLGGL